MEFEVNILNITEIVMKMTDVRQCQEKEVADHKNRRKTTGRRERGETYQLCLRRIKLKATNSSKILATVQHDP